MISLMKRYLFVLGLIFALSPAFADQGVQRTTYGMSLSLQGQLLDLNAPICAPASGSYSVSYRNSIATGCTGRASDDFATLEDTDSTPDTYTIPQSKVSTFTGSISGTTLTTPANAVIVGSVITGVGVTDNTYVTATTNSTTWTVNNSQTVGSETLTQSVFPPGHGTCFKNNGTSLLTLAATTSTIKGAAGVVNGNPAVTGGQVVLYPGGEACLQAGPDNNYRVSGFLPGSWYQSATPGSPVSAFQWIGLSGYPRLHLSCSSIGAIGSSGTLFIQLAYGGTFQTTGYSWNEVVYGNNTVNSYATTAEGIELTGAVPININDGITLDIDFSFAGSTGMGFSNDAKFTLRYTDATLGEAGNFGTGSAPLTTTQAVTGIKIYPNAGTFYGMCWLTPRT
jgi:hypothetical protein